MKHIIHLLIAVVLGTIIPAAGVAAGTITGSVREAGSGHPVHGAFVILRELNTASVTGEDGGFVLRNIPDGSYIIRAGHVGYSSHSITVTVPTTGPVEIELVQSPHTTEETVTTARGHETSRADVPGSVETVDASDFIERVPVSIPEALSLKPGIAVSSDMPWSQRVVIRGLMKDQVIMLVDGCRVVTATETAAEFGTVANGDIERIEVLKGPISVLYGSGSTGGVVNVITRKSRFSDTPSLTASVNPSYEESADGFGMYERADFSSQKFYIGVSQANRDYSDYRASDGLKIKNTGFRDRQTQVNLGIMLSPSHIIEARRQDFKASDVGIPGARSFPKDAVATYPATTRTLTDVAWTWRPSFEWWKESRLNGYYQPIHRDVEMFPNTVQTAPGKRITPESIYPGAYHRVSGGSWRNMFSAGGHTVVAGMESWRKDMESYRTKNIRVEVLDSNGNVTKTMSSSVKDKPLPDSSQQPFGFFAEDAFAIGKRLNVTLGGRFDIIRTENDLTYKQYAPMDSTVLWNSSKDTDKSGSFVAGAVFRAVEGLDLKLTVARSFRAPTIEERYLYADLGGVLTVGNPAIDPEKGTFAEAGVVATTGSLRFNGQAYVNSLSDMVTQTKGTFTDGREAWISTNAGKALLWGYEAGADWAPSQSLIVSADATWSRGTDTKKNADLPFMPPPRGHVSVRWYAWKTFWVEPLATFVYRQNHVASGEISTPGYGYLNITTGKTLEIGNSQTHELVIGIRNISDKRYRDHLATSRGYDLFSPGRSLFVSLRMNYN